MEKVEFEQKVFILKDKIFRFACSILSNVADAEDVVQEVFTKMWCDKNNLRGIKNIEAYVMRSTKNMCVDRLRHTKMRVYKTEKIKNIYPQTYRDESIENSDIKVIIKTIIDALPEKQRMVIHLRDIEGYEFEEIESVLGMNLIAVRTNLSRARKKLKEEMTKIMSYGISR